MTGKVIDYATSSAKALLGTSSLLLLDINAVLCFKTIA